MRTKFDYTVKRNDYTGEVESRMLAVFVTGSKKESKEDVERYADSLLDAYIENGFNGCVDFYDYDSNSIIVCLGEIEAEEKEVAQDILRDFKKDVKEGKVDSYETEESKEAEAEEVTESVVNVTNEEESNNTYVIEINEENEVSEEVIVEIEIKNNLGKVMNVKTETRNRQELLNYFEFNNYKQVTSNKFVKAAFSGATKTYTIIEKDNNKEAEEVTEHKTSNTTICTTLNQAKNNFKETGNVKQLIKQLTYVMVNMSKETLKKVCDYYGLNFNNNYFYNHDSILAKDVVKIVNSITKINNDKLLKMVYAMVYNKDKLIKAEDRKADSRLFITLM